MLNTHTHGVSYDLKILFSIFWSFTTLYINKGQWIYMFHYTMLVHNQHMKHYNNSTVQCGLKQHATVLPICKTTITWVVRILCNNLYTYKEHPS